MALVLVVVLGLVALVLDRLWLDMATVEAQGVAEAAALAAGRELASDDLLVAQQMDSEDRIRRAQIAAENIAALNRVAGQPLVLDASRGEVRFGTNLFDEEVGEMRFVESPYQARSVRISALRSHAKRNPVALFFGGLTRVPTGEVAAYAEATIDNHVVGLQVVGGAPIPALPLAILARAPAGSAVPTWRSQIEERRGLDRYRFDHSTGTVVAGKDGIREIELTPVVADSNPRDSNVRLVCVHATRDLKQCQDQIRTGWSADHLEHRNRRIEFSSGPQIFNASRSIPDEAAHALREVTGECRAILLFHDEWSDSNDSWSRVQAGVLVAGRVMAVNQQPGQPLRVIVQPAVLATRSAMLTSDLKTPSMASEPDPLATARSEAGLSEPYLGISGPEAQASAEEPPGDRNPDHQAPRNKYIYQLKLTE